MANTYHTYRVLTFCSNNTEKSDKISVDKRDGKINNIEEKKESKGSNESKHINETHANKDDGNKKVKDAHNAHCIFTLKKGENDQYKAVTLTSRVAKETKQHLTKDYNLRHFENNNKIITEPPKKEIPKETELLVSKDLSEIIMQQPQRRHKKKKSCRSKNKSIIEEPETDIVNNDGDKEKQVRKIKQPRKKISIKDAKHFFTRYQSERRKNNSKKQLVEMIYNAQNVGHNKALLGDYNNNQANIKAKHKTIKDELNTKSFDVSKRVGDFYFNRSNETENILRLQTKNKSIKKGHKKLKKTTYKQKKTRSIRLFKVSSKLPLKRKKTRAKIINLDYFRRKFSFHVNSSSFNGKKLSNKTNSKLNNHSKPKTKQNPNDDLQILFSRQASKNLRSTEKNMHLEKCHSKDLFGFHKNNRSYPVEYWKCSTNTCFNPNMQPHLRKCRSLEQNYLTKKVKQLRDKCRQVLPLHISIPKFNEAASELQPCNKVSQPKTSCDDMPTTYQDPQCDDRTIDLKQYESRSCEQRPCDEPCPCMIPVRGPLRTYEPPPCEAPHPRAPSPRARASLPPPCDTCPCKQISCDPLRTVEFPNGTGDFEIYRVKPKVYAKKETCKPQKPRSKKKQTEKKCGTDCSAICCQNPKQNKNFISRKEYCPESGDAKTIDDQICCVSDDEESDDSDDCEVERRPSCDLKPESALVITIRSCLVCMVMICWLPCILLVFICWLITYPMRPHACKNEEKKPLFKTFIEWIRTARWYNLSFLDVFWSMLHENCQDLEHNSTKCSISKTSVRGIIKKKISKQKTKKKLPCSPCLKTPKAPQVPCQQMSQLPPCLSPFPNKNRQYTLCHTTSRGWVMKPQREERMPPSILKKEGQSNRSRRVLNFKGAHCPPCPVREVGTRAPRISRRCQAGMQGICIEQRIPAVAQATTVPPRPSVTKVTCACTPESPTRGGTCTCTRRRSPIRSPQVPKPKPTCKCKVSTWKKCSRNCRNMRKDFNEFEKSTFNPNASCEEMYLSTMRNKPCFFMYECCPQTYPFVLQMCSMCRNCCHMCLLMLSACIWIPWMLICYLCFKVLCTCFK